MSSIDNHYRQRQPSFFMPISSLQGLIYSYNATAGTTTFTPATWASATATGPYATAISSIGAGILKDLGKQIVSSNRVFRKVQLVVRNGALTGNQSTFGVAGQGGTVPPNQDFLTGYIELGYEGGGPATPVVNYGAF
jgi:hypothetical protein